MKRSLMALALLTSSFLLAGCEPEKVVQHIPTPPDRLICEAAGARPAIPAEYTIDWASVVSVEQAKTEHAKYVTSIRNREGVITGYIVLVEGKLFTCQSNMDWRRTYEAELARAQ